MTPLEITKEWLESIPMEDDLLDTSAGVFRFEPWSIAESDDEPASAKSAEGQTPH